MGLGLSISKSIIENMGGEISFTTTLDIGTTFTIKLHKKRHEN
jgi:signal transduction histidine kinase